jgi:hypothetical protein
MSHKWISNAGCKRSRVIHVVMDGKGESNHGSFYEFRGRNQSVSGQLIVGHRTLQRCQKRPVAYCHLTVQQVDFTISQETRTDNALQNRKVVKVYSNLQ